MRWKLLEQILGKPRRPPSIPDGQCVYAVGDIHGRMDLLAQLLDQLWSDAPAAGNTLIFLGDYIDRGPAAKDVIETLLSLRRPGWDIVNLRGNHEEILLDFLGDPAAYKGWRELGGADTLQSYGVRPPMFTDIKEIRRAHDEFAAALPPSHRVFLMGLSNYYVAGDYFFVHAGVRPGVPLDKQTPEDLLWIRDDFLASDTRLEKVIVHGHSPSEGPILRPNRIGIDTGAYATNCLTAIKLSGKSCKFYSTSDTQSPR